MNLNKYFKEKQQLLDKIANVEKEIIREISVKIKELHCGKKVDVVAVLKKLRELQAMVQCKEKVLTAEQEFVELLAFKTFIEEGRLLKIDELPELENKVEAYLLGILDFTGELKRYAVDKIIAGNLNTAKKAYELMKEVYYSFKTLAFPNFLLPKFRPKLDVLRIQLEQLADLIARKIL